jgi:hypothetical protein
MICLLGTKNCIEPKLTTYLFSVKNRTLHSNKESGQTDIGQNQTGQTDIGQSQTGQTDIGQKVTGQTDVGR